MELALTLVAFDVSNKLATLLVGSGLIFLPVAWLFWKNWYEPARSQEAKAAAPVSLRRMEQDIGLAMLAMLLAFLPAINISSSEIIYKSPLTGNEVNAGVVDTDTSPAAQNIRIPVLWWAVIQFSSGFTEIFTAAVHSVALPQHLRTMALALDYVDFSDETLITELAQFDQHCYIPAIEALDQDPDGTVYIASGTVWRGFYYFKNNSNYYNRLRPAPPFIPAGWEDQYNHPDNPGPTCATWWIAHEKGLRDKIYDLIQGDTKNELETKPKGLMKFFESTQALIASKSSSAKDDAIRYFLRSKNLALQSPANKQISDDQGFSMLATLGSWFAYPVVKTTMTALIVVLPMVQAIILACIYIALPLAVPFAVVRPGVLVFFISAIFGTKFLTGIWALANFIDERFIDALHGGDPSGHGILMWFVAVLSYAGLPVIWFWLMSSFTSRAIGGINNLFTSTATQMAVVGHAGVGQTTNLGGKAVTSFIKPASKDK